MSLTRTIIRLEETSSTNSYLRSLSPRPDSGIVVVTAGYQTNGRGQGSNTWESGRGENVLMSMSVCPEGILAARQFSLSMAGALAVKDVLDIYAAGIRLKWPNDVYAGDRKISGTLIETSLCGRHVKECVFGIGINVNQQTFFSDAPNPVSLWQITGVKADPDKLAMKVVEAFERRYETLLAGGYSDIAGDYRASLYRREGFFPYQDKNGAFMAELQDVTDEGLLVLRDDSGRRRVYAFKEVKYII